MLFLKEVKVFVEMTGCRKNSVGCRKKHQKENILLKYETTLPQHRIFLPIPCKYLRVTKSMLN